MKRSKTQSSAAKKAGTIVVVGLAALLVGFGIAVFSSYKGDGNGSAKDSSEHIEIRPLAAEDPKDFVDNPEATRAEILRLCWNQPESLASFIAAYPSLTEASELPLGGKTPTATNIDNLMDSSEVGAEVQQKMYEALDAALNRNDTEIIFRSAKNGWMDLQYAFVRDTEKPLSPSNIGLIMVPAYVGEGKFVTIRIKTPDGSTEEATFDISTGFQYASVEAFS